MSLTNILRVCLQFCTFKHEKKTATNSEFESVIKFSFHISFYANKCVAINSIIMHCCKGSTIVIYMQLYIYSLKCLFYFQKISLAEQLYIVDNLAFFIYQTQDEPLFIIHQIDIIVSVSGSNLLQSFREVSLFPIPIENIQVKC